MVLRVLTIGQLQKANQALRKYPIVSHQMDFSLITRSVEKGLIEYCLQNQITIIAHSPLGRGLKNIKDRDQHLALHSTAMQTGHSEAQIALNR